MNHPQGRTEFRDEPGHFLENPQMPVSLEETQQIDLLSEVNGHTYRLFVALPNGYAADDTTRYPVLYLLHGYRTFLLGTPENGLA
jgi:enterochelin esterase-like enzyme